MIRRGHGGRQHTIKLLSNKWTCYQQASNPNSLICGCRHSPGNTGCTSGAKLFRRQPCIIHLVSGRDSLLQVIISPNFFFPRVLTCNEEQTAVHGRLMHKSTFLRGLGRIHDNTPHAFITKSRLSLSQMAEVWMESQGEAHGCEKCGN